MLAPSMLANPNGAEHPIGTGPFVYTAWVPNTHFTAVRNQHYWRKGLPHLDSVTYKPIVDPTSAAEALQLGSVDMINTNTASIIKEYRGNRQWSYVDNSLDVVGEPTVDCILLNCAAPPFSDRNARLAMAKAYTQAAICRTFGLEVNTPVTSPFPPGTQYHEKTTYPGYDPAGARAAVEAYEHAHGQTPSFTLRCPPDPQTQRVMTYLQQRYQDVGMTVSLSSVAQNTMIEDVAFGTFQAVAWRQFGAVDPDANYVFWAADTVEGSGISLNFARNKDPRIQRALTSARQSDSPAARTAAYRSIGEYLAQDLPYTWLGRSVWAVVANPKVQNFNNPQAPDGSAIIGLSGGSTWPTSVWIGS
jgi:peptide/nickel transport system substrate-binding protein